VLDDYDYGVLGVGEIGAAIVTGLCQDVGDAPRILLSPRNAGRAAALAARFPSVSVAAGNQELASRCSALVLSVRPGDARAILGGLTFQPGQAIISLIAGVPGSELAPLVAPARDIARAIPLPPVARRAGITPVHPGTPAARALFDRLGGSSDVEEAGAFEAMSAASGTIAAHLRYLATISGWLSGQGVAREQAARYVSSVYATVAEDLGASDGDLDGLARAHATPGGLNERFSALLEAAGVFDAVGQSLQAVYDKLQASGLRNPSGRRLAQPAPAGPRGGAWHAGPAGFRGRPGLPGRVTEYLGRAAGRAVRQGRSYAPSASSLRSSSGVSSKSKMAKFSSIRSRRCDRGSTTKPCSTCQRRMTCAAVLPCAAAISASTGLLRSLRFSGL
jgi:pyrroline-5-carboxylate reductase